jgi:GNAT superfamily N-acetyltransferase
MGLLHRWFNAAPSPAWHPLTDKRGTKYWFCWDDEFYNAHILRFGKPIGQIFLLWQDDGVVELADIVIWPLEHRQHGLGKALMNEIVALARQRGAKAIVGRIVARQEAQITFEYLRKWYQRQGFEVSEEGELFMSLLQEESYQ